LAAQRIVVIGGSAGAVEALLDLVSRLPADFPAPIFVTIHIPADSPSILPELVARRTYLRAKHAENGERYRQGTIYVAPPDRHMLIEPNGKIRVVRGPRENRHRPAVDPLFRSAAAAAGRNVIAVVLTGNLDDGTAGAIAVKQRGGTLIVQDPREALHASMPQSAMSNAEVDYVLRLSEIARKLTELAAVPPSPVAVPNETVDMMDMENRITEFDANTLQQDDRPGAPSAFSCPDCGGVLWEIKEGDFVRFRCRVGHAFSPETMLGAQSDILEQALWSALKTLEESARLSKRLADTERERGHTWMAARFDEREKDARERADTIRKVLVSSTSEVPQPTTQEIETGTEQPH
jgi:two-component system chemotaxis response regulator CheB